MKNLNITNTANKQEPVEVMALFTYGLNPCEPLRFKRDGQREQTVTELIRTKIRFLGAGSEHIFDVMSGRQEYRLIFNSENLHWRLIKM
jgi:hypothetical protein